MDNLDKQLKKVWGYDSFRGKQKEVCETIIGGIDSVSVFATGTGKSVCFQLPATLMDGTMIVVTPLISLMRDQVKNAKAVGISAESLSSDCEYAEQLRITKLVEAGKIKLLYVAPERFSTPRMRRLLETIKVSAVVVDELHCAEAGKGYRPGYFKAAEIIKNMDVVKAGFTATATDELLAELVDRFGFKKPKIFKSSFDRTNLYYEVRNKIGDGMQQVFDFITSRPDEGGIVYRCTRASVEATAAALNAEGIKALPYHAGMPPEARRRAQDEFVVDRVKVIVATIAFGTGVDKPNIRWIIHNDIPKDLSGLAQEQGRAGRDGKPAHCLFLYHPNDASTVWRVITSGDSVYALESIERLKEVIQYAQAHRCRRKAMLAHFGEQYEGNCGMCDVCCSKSVAAIGDNRKKILFKR